MNPLTLDNITLDEYLANDYLPKSVHIHTMGPVSARNNNHPVWNGIYNLVELKCIAQGIPSEAGQFIYGWTLSPKQHMEALITILNYDSYNWNTLRGKDLETLRIVPKFEILETVVQ